MKFLLIGLVFVVLVSGCTNIQNEITNVSIQEMLENPLSYLGSTVTVTGKFDLLQNTSSIYDAEGFGIFISNCGDFLIGSEQTITGVLQEIEFGAGSSFQINCES